MKHIYQSSKDYFSNLVSIFSLVIKRLIHHRGISLSTIIGIVSVLSLIICVPIFTTAVLSQVLKQSLIDKSIANHRSMFSVHAYYRDDFAFTLFSVSNSQYISDWISDEITTKMGLDLQDIFMEVQTASYSWAPIEYQASKPPFENIIFNIASDNLTQQKTKLVEGEWPSDDYALNPNGPIPVVVEEGYADDNFLNVGDIYRSKNAESLIEIEVVGIFRAIDPNDLSWFYSPETTYQRQVWVPMAYFDKVFPQLITRPINFVSWYAIVDDHSLRFNNSLQISHSMTRLDTDLHLLLPEIRIDYTPALELKNYEDRMASLITLFYVAGAPLILLALIFISLTASIALQQESQEITTLRGRGVNFTNIIGLNLLESLVLLILAIPLSLFIGWLLAGVMSQTQLFLQFTRHSTLSLSINDVNPGWIAIISLVIVAARLLPLWGLRRTTAVNIRQEKSRNIKRPFWEKIFLDFILLVPAVYAYQIMRGKVQPVELLSNLNISSTNEQSDPLLFLASSLFAVSVCMISLRLFPLLMGLAAKLSNGFKHAGSYLAVQEIARRPQEHASVMLLIMISLSLAIFSASMAKTLDQWMHDSQYYQVGTDLSIKEYEVPASTNPNQVDTPTTQEETQKIESAGVQALVSLENHLSIPGIESATFVGDYTGQCNYSYINHNCNIMGIDRSTFISTAFYRNDFSRDSLGALMNALAANPKGILVPQSLLDESGLKIGDQITVIASIGLYKQGFNENMTIVGAYDYFPTVYFNQDATIIANLGTLFGSQEAATDYNVWLKIDENTDYQSVLNQLTNLAFKDDLLVKVEGNSIQQIQTLLDRPEWVGLFGILSVGFLLTGLMACIGFILDTFASLKMHYVQLGILQAIGLSTRQLVSYLVLERVMIMAIALVCGTGIGLLTSVLYVPILQISAAAGTPIPPFQVLIGWSQSTWLIISFGLVLLAVIIGTVAYLLQIKIFQAVKMGETI